MYIEEREVLALVQSYPLAEAPVYRSKPFSVVKLIQPARLVFTTWMNPRLKLPLHALPIFGSIPIVAHSRRNRTSTDLSSSYGQLDTSRFEACKRPEVKTSSHHSTRAIPVHPWF